MAKSWFFMNGVLREKIHLIAIWILSITATSLNSYTDKKENQIFLIYKDIQSGAVAKSYMRKGFLICEKMRKYFPIHEGAVSHIVLCNCSILNFLIYEENLIFFFISVYVHLSCSVQYWGMSMNRVLSQIYFLVFFEEPMVSAAFHSAKLLFLVYIIYGSYLLFADSP